MRLGLQRLLVLTNAVATVGFLLLTHLPVTGRYSPLLAAVTFVGFGTAGTHSAPWSPRAGGWPTVTRASSAG